MGKENILHLRSIGDAHAMLARHVSPGVGCSILQSTIYYQGKLRDIHFQSLDLLPQATAAIRVYVIPLIALPYYPSTHTSSSRTT